MGLQITSDNISASTLSTLGSVKLISVTYPGTQTAVDVTGGETMSITGSGFNTGVVVYANATTCTTTRVSSTLLTFTTPAMSAGTYYLIVYNTDGSSGIIPAAITFNTPPVWVTNSGALTLGNQNSAYSFSLSATGTGITYSVTSGSLPTGLSLNSSTGAITGTPTTAATSNFTVTASNNNNQTTARSFSIQVVAATSITYLVVAGGGSGGTGYYGGGGGAGGLLTGSVSLLAGTTLTITVGSGGTGTTTQTNRGGNGGNSSITGSGFTTVLSIGGGGGGSRNNDTANGNAAGANGGSGGGTSFPPTSTGGIGVYPGSTYLSQARQGYDGAPAPVYGTDYGSGGGGAGAVGKYGSGNSSRDGGIGLQSSITGTSTYYSGGGAGAYGTWNGGTGGGGNTNSAGSPNTGGGGGGASPNNTAGGTGGSGVVIISYANTNPAATSTTGSPTITDVGGNRIYKYTGSGTFTL